LATHIELCEAVKDFINAPLQQEQYVLKFVAQRLNMPIVSQLEDTNELRVTVFPGQRTRVSSSRNDWQVIKQVFVVLQKKIVGDTAAEEIAEQDVMMDLAEAIEDTLQNQDMLDMGRYEEIEVTKSPYAEASLETEHHFTSVSPVSYIGFSE
jgi:hypothetical protein